MLDFNTNSFDQQGQVITELPRNLYIPSDGQSIDIRALASIPAGTNNFQILSFTAPPSGQTTFIGYAIFNDALTFSTVEFLPTVNGSRIFPFHGDPQQNYKIGLGVGPDISNSSLIQCTITLNPGQVLRWGVTNTDVVSVVMGVRMVGYLSSGSKRVEQRVGG